MTLMRMAWLFALKRMRLGSDAALDDMASFPRTDPFCRNICSLERTSLIVYGL